MSQLGIFILRVCINNLSKRPAGGNTVFFLMASKVMCVVQMAKPNISIQRIKGSSFGKRVVSKMGIAAHRIFRSFFCLKIFAHVYQKVSIKFYSNQKKKPRFKPAFAKKKKKDCLVNFFRLQRVSHQ